MDCPRCGTPMEGGICLECGFPVNRIAMDEKKCADDNESSASAYQD